MRQAIITKYHPATPCLGSRMSATAHAGRVYTPYDYTLDEYENHEKAADALRDKFRWDTKYTPGYLPNAGQIVWVC